MVPSPHPKDPNSESRDFSDMALSYRWGEGKDMMSERPHN